MSVELLNPDIKVNVEINHTLAALEQRGIQPIFVANRRAALMTVLELIPHGSTVAHGHSNTLQEIGLIDYLHKAGCGYRYLNPGWQAENDRQKRARWRAELSLEAEYYLGSVQAICETGEVIGADASGSRQAFYIYGPSHVIWVAGINKLVPTVADGLRRVREVALPLEDERIRQAGGTGSYIGKLVIYEQERPGRITLVLVGEALGF
jgi:hypothetical protein